MKYKIKKLLKE